MYIYSYRSSTVRYSNMQFNSWLNEYIFTPNCSLKRKYCIKYFTRALYDFIILKGYTWKISEKDLRKYIVTGLYKNSRKSHIASEWNYSDVNTDYSDDDYNHYLFILDSYAWNSFWAINGLWGDLSENSFRGQDRRSDIEAFVWKQLNIKESYQTEELYEILMAGEEDAPTTTTVDVYLNEAVEYNGWGGIRR